MQFKLFSSFICITFALSATQNILANTSPKPTCPSVTAIQSVSLDNVIRWDNWIVFRWAAQYNTPNHWRFSIGKFRADDAMDALTQAKKSLATLAFVEGPNENRRGEWQCRYVTAGGYEGVAFLLEDEDLLHH